MADESVKALLDFLDAKDREIQELKTEIEHLKIENMTLRGEIFYSMNDASRNPGLIFEYEEEIKRLQQIIFELNWRVDRDRSFLEAGWIPNLEDEGSSNQIPPEVLNERQTKTSTSLVEKKKCLEKENKGKSTLKWPFVKGASTSDTKRK